jgi:hypothetical protein
MNKHTLRFLYIYPLGYWNDKLAGSPDERVREGGDTPAIAIGKCSPLSGPLLTPQDAPSQARPSPKKTRERRP